jgi:hypothetical protein
MPVRRSNYCLCVDLGKLSLIQPGRCQVSQGFEGTIYLLHFERPYHGPMQHYVGFTADDRAAPETA